MNATTLPAAWAAARRFADRWQDLYPKAAACLRAESVTVARRCRSSGSFSAVG